MGLGVGTIPRLLSETAEIPTMWNLACDRAALTFNLSLHMTTPSGNATASAPNAQLVCRDDSTIISGARPAGATHENSLVVAGHTRSDDAGDAFAIAYVIAVTSLTETLCREIASARGLVLDRGDEDQREVRAAVWSTIRGALAASLLSSRQQQVVLGALSNRLRSHWQESLCSRDEVAGPISERAGFYLQHVDPQDPVTTAVRVVEILLEATAVPQEQRDIQTRPLAGLIAHRFVSDVWLFNEWQSQGKAGPSAQAGK